MLVEFGVAGRIMLADVDNLRDLKVVIEESVPLPADGRLAGLGQVVDGYAWLDVEALFDAARNQATKPDWVDEYRAMIVYASTKGWADETGAVVRAHVERGSGRSSAGTTEASSS